MLQKAAVLIPWLVEEYSRNKLKGVRERLYKYLENEKDAEMLYETINAVLENGEYNYSSIAIDLGILSEGENRSKGRK